MPDQISLFEGDGSAPKRQRRRGGLAGARFGPRAALRAVPRARGQPAARVPDGHQFLELSGLAGHRVHAQARHVDAGAGKGSTSTRSTRCCAPSASTAASTRRFRTTTCFATRTSCGDEFPCCAKAPAAVTSESIPGLTRHHPNPDYLSAPRLIAEMIEPFARSFARHTGPVRPAVLAAGGPRRRPTPTRSSSGWTVSRGSCRASTATRSRFATSGRSPTRTATCSRATARRTSTTTGRRCRCRARRPGRFRPRSSRSSWCACCCGRGSGTRIRSRSSRRSTSWSSPTTRCAGTCSTSCTARGHGQRETFLLVNNKAEGSAPLTIEALAERFVAESH